MRNLIPLFFLIHTEELCLFDNPQHRLSPQNSLRNRIPLSLLIRIRVLRFFHRTRQTQSSLNLEVRKILRHSLIPLEVERRSEDN